MLRVSIIGCGMIARKRHFPEMQENPNVQLVACSDYILERAQEIAAVYGCKAYQDYKELLKLEKPDVVVVCTNNATHAQVTLDSLQVGAHVLCEKPMCANLDEAREMILMARQAGKKLMIAQNQRMAPAHQKAKEILESGRLGNVLTFRTVFGHPGCEYWSIDGASSWFFKKDLAIFGCLADLGVHKVDLLRWLLDDEFDEVSSFCATRDKKGPDQKPISVEDNMIGLLHSRKGIIGTIATSWTYYGPEDNSTIIYCQKGIMSISADPKYLVKIDYPDGTKELYEIGGIGTNDKPVKTGIDDEFINSILEDRTPAISGEEGYNSLAVAVALHKSYESRELSKVLHFNE